MEVTNRLKGLFKNKIFLSSSFLAAVSFLSGIMNFVFNMIIGRVLGPDEFGIVYPLTSLLMIISIPSKAIQTVTTDEVSMLLADKNHGKIKALFPKIVLTVTIVTAGFIAGLLLLMPFLKGLLHIENTTALIITIASVLVTTVYIPFYSLTQSRERFFVAGLTQILGTVGKFAVGIGIVMSLRSYFGALWGNFAGSIVMMLVLVIDMFTFKPLFDKKVVKVTNEPRRKEILNSFLYSFLSFGAFQLITYLDSILVRHFMPGESGLYSIVNLLGKASFFIAAAFSFVMLPIMSKDKQNTSVNNRKGLLLLSGVLIAYVAALVLFSGFLSRVIFAGKYPGMDKLLPLYGVMFLPFAFISYLVNYYFMTRKYLYTITLLVGSAALCLGIAFFHTSLAQVSYVVGIVGYSVLAILLLDSLILEKRRKK